MLITRGAEARAPRGRRIATLSPLLAALLTAASAAQQPPKDEAQENIPAFSAEVEQVTVDTVITDKKGKAVTDLTMGDFSVFEDGVPQSISSFEAIKVPETAAKPPAKPQIATNFGTRPKTARTFVIVFDDVHTSRGNGERAKTAIGEFLKKAVREGDHVTLISTGGNAWWSAEMEQDRDQLLALLKRLEGRYIPDRTPERMSEWEAMKIEVYDDQEIAMRVLRRYDTNGVINEYHGDLSGRSSKDIDPVQRGTHDPKLTGKATEVYFHAVEKLRMTLSVLKRVLDSLAASKGRKAVILVTDGFIRDPVLTDFKEVVEASRRANAAIYSFDSLGFKSLPLDYTAESAGDVANADLGAAFQDSTISDEGSDDLASDTGGFSVKNVADLTTGIQRIANESLAYYLLGYTPTNTKQDGKFRKIEVRVNRKDVQVRARKGYYAPADPSIPQKKPEPTSVDPQIQLALDSPYEAPDVPLRMTAYVTGEAVTGKANATVVTEVDLRNFAFKEEEGRFSDTLEFLMVVADRDTGEYWRYDQKVTMRLSKASRDKLFKSWFPLAKEFELPTGAYQAKMVVRDKNVAKVGTVTYDFEVPDLSAFQVSTIALSDTLEQAPENPSQAVVSPALIARRTFPAGAELYGRFSVFGATKGSGDGMPKVSAGYVIRGPDGGERAASPASLIKPTSLGKLTRIIGTSLAGYPAGDYDFELSIKDELTGKTLEAHETFSIAASAPSPSASR